MAIPDVDWSCPPGYRHPKFVRSLALQLWGLKCSRDFGCTRRELEARAVDDGLSCVPDVRTLRSWADSEDWSGEIARMMRSIAPDLIGGLVIDLVMGASEGAPWLRRVLNGQESKPNSTRVRAVLSALSMIGIPDLAHQAMRESRDDSGIIAPGSDVGVVPLSESASMPTDMGEWKSGLAQRLGHMDAE